MSDEPARRHVSDKPDQPSETAPWWIPALFCGGLIALGSAYVALVTLAKDLPRHAHIGDALAPVTSFLSLFAVVAALWSVHVQRRELELQRRELGDNRKVMEKQMEQLRRSATAQRRLADAQLMAAEAACRVGMNDVMLSILGRHPERVELHGAIDHNGHRLDALTRKLEALLGESPDNRV